MRLRVIVLMLLISAVASSTATAGVYAGWKSYSDFCKDEDSKAKGAAALGFGYQTGLLQIVKLRAALEYSWGDIDYDCLLCKDTSFKHVAARAEAIIPIFKPSITEFYIGGGLSYNWFYDVSLDDCGTDKDMTGIHGLGGVKIAPPVLPVWFTVEGRYEWLGSDPQITVGGVYLGVGSGL
ncbi:hypothetical protein ACFL2Z_05200 [Candidatus Eisenbacteria bacterium]|uniref:Outer membrane protein beta-barrel domain-containing protein n=1 Tax=Eiseniibacteriota bacterium TaxID=2212470 RepID=A0ABV6YQE5_UNCEI